MNAQVTLYRVIKERISLDEALQAFGERVAIGLLYAPHACVFMCWRQGRLVPSPDSRFPPLSEAYEARVFDETGELRWLRDPGSDTSGYAVYLTEDAEVWKERGSVVPIAELERLDNRYLLWGERSKNLKSPSPDGWVCLSTARLGTLWVPPVVELNAAQRIGLETVEYLGLDSSPAGTVHGNTVVREERLLRLVPWTCEAGASGNPESVVAEMEETKL
jgi:CRISPR-associated protein (TIGR03984 family)